MKKQICKAFSLIMVVMLCVSLFSVPAAAAFDVGPVSNAELDALCRAANVLGRKYEILYDSTNSCYRMKDMKTGAWYVTATGEYPYIPAKGDAPAEGPGTAPAQTPDFSATSRNEWRDIATVDWTKCQVILEGPLRETAVGLKARGIDCNVVKYNDFWIIRTSNGRSIYCNSTGGPYVASAAPAMADNDFDYIVDNSDNSTTNNTVNNQVIDTSNNQMTVINENGDKITLNIDSLYWDDSTHTYTANTYNIQNNIYNYYTYNITYNITNTYITYIGSNGAYQQEEYKYYYELPDGRSSEDLTAEEVGAMSFQFADVVNYARSATDTSLRALYHFDGNTEDSGYFSTQTKFTWDVGASITYMDSANFNGALYLDETPHNFDVDLPSNFPSSTDFSIQFRHYQASQPDTQSNINNSLAIGGVTVLRWDERYFYWGSSGSTSCASVPIGSWAELALVRHNGTLYFYINGLKIASKADTTGYQGKLMFSFGTTSRQYTMLDELRVLNFAFAKSGASYQCATAPFDTNLVLVLPDGAFPVADEYWDFKNDTAIMKDNFTQGIMPSGWYHEGGLAGEKEPFFSSGFTTFYKAGAINHNGYGVRKRLWGEIPGDSVSRPYSFSIIGTDGTVYTTPSFTISRSSQSLTSAVFRVNGAYSQRLRFTFPWGVVQIHNGGSGTSSIGVQVTIFVTIPSFDFIYMEVASTPITDFEFVTCIYSSEEVKPNTAAVQSSIPVAGYTVGGVRPTFPARGDVWFPVEGRRISGCYQYDGAMWRVAGCRWYTGERWIPIYAFDIYTLADCWDAADGDTVDPTPPITSEQGFWNWFKKEWTDFRKWGNTSVQDIIKAIGSGGGGTTLPEGACEHKYRYKDISPATCTAKGSRLFTCGKCGDTYTEEVAYLGHDWIQIDDIQDTTDTDGTIIKGYALWECSRCQLQHKDYDRTGPPPDKGDSTITESINALFDKLGALGGSLLDWLFELATEAMDGLGNIGDYFAEKSEEVGGFGGEFLLLLSGFFAIIPSELMSAMSLAIVFLVLGLFVKQVLLK